MTTEIRRNDGNLTVVLSGRLDSTTSGELEEILKKELDGEVSSLTVDLERIDFISSKGLRVLVGAYQTLNGKEMTLSGANSSIKELLRMSGLLKIFTVL